jgi:hypothetical protein
VNPELDRVLAGKAGVWLVQWQDDIVDPMGTLRLILEAHGELIDARWQPRGPVLYRYGLPPNVRIAHGPPIAEPMQVDFGNRLRFLGYSLPKYREAGVVELIPFWQALGSVVEDYKVSLRLVDSAGHRYALNDGWPATVGYPTPLWPAGRVVFGRQRVSPLKGTPAGEYWVDMLVYEAQTLAPLQVLDEGGSPLGASARIGPFDLAPSDPPNSLEDVTDEVQSPRQVVFGNDLELVGYSWEPGPVSPGESIEFTVFWRGLRKLNRDYAVLFPFVDAQGRLRSQPGGPSPDAIGRAMLDAEGVLIGRVTGPLEEAAEAALLRELGATGSFFVYPLGGLGYPTSAWREGEVVRTLYTYGIPADAPAGPSQLRVLVLGREGQVGVMAVLIPLEIQVESPSCRPHRLALLAPASKSRIGPGHLWSGPRATRSIDEPRGLD